MEDLAKRYHREQYRNKDKVPYIEHLVGIKSILFSVFEITGECTDEALLEDMLNASLGHDLIEDTEVTEGEIIAVSNEQVLALVKELTNPVDDAHTDEYMGQLSKASEEARVIKYCDLLENTMSVCYGLHDLGVGWFNDFYWPILEKTTKVLADTEFAKYPRTVSLLRSMLKISTDLAQNKLGLIEEE